MGDDRPSRYEENGITVYRASALGSCLKSLTALGLGMTPESHPDWLLVKFQQGIDGEPVILSMLNDVGNDDGAWRIVDMREGHWLNWHDGQVIVEIPVGDKCIIRGHLDGIGVCWAAPVGHGVELGQRRVVEVKCCTEDYAKTVLKKLPPMYEVQISAYGGHFRMPVLLAVGVKGGKGTEEEGVVVKVRTQLIDELPLTMAQVKARVAEVERRVECGELGDCDYRQWPCQFPWLCDEVEWGGKPATPDGEIESVLEASIREARGRNG